MPTTSLSRSGADDEAWTLPDPKVRTPTATAENRELGEQIELALESLGRDQREAFVLREYEGLGYADIAQVMGISEGTVKSRLHRAKQALRDRLGPYLEATN